MDIVFYLLTGSVVTLVAIHFWMIRTADQLLDEDDRNIHRNDWNA